MKRIMMDFSLLLTNTMHAYRMAIPFVPSSQGTKSHIRIDYYHAQCGCSSLRRKCCGYTRDTFTQSRCLRLHMQAITRREWCQMRSVGGRR